MAVKSDQSLKRALLLIRVKHGAYGRDRRQNRLHADRPYGRTVNLVSRLDTVASAGSVAISEYTRKLVEGFFELRPLGPMGVKGISEHVNKYEAAGLGLLRTHFELSARRGLTRFIGPERELHQIHYALELAMSGHGQLVAVVAEAGAGKLRLFHEFKATLPAECKLPEAYSLQRSAIPTYYCASSKSPARNQRPDHQSGPV